MSWQDVPVPKRMRALQRDRRGYPVPFIVLRDTDGRGHFTINDSTRQLRCLKEKRCPVCGNRLDKLMWFVGGPLAAFHVHGAYLDSAMHHECMRYALQVCPYLAAPNYLGRIDTATIDPAKVPGGCKILLDHTMIPDRPELFVCVASHKQQFNPPLPGGLQSAKPERPFVAMEFWAHGEQLDHDTGMRLSMERLSANTELNLYV